MVAKTHRFPVNTKNSILSNHGFYCFHYSIKIVFLIVAIACCLASRFTMAAVVKYNRIIAKSFKRARIFHGIYFIFGNTVADDDSVICLQWLKHNASNCIATWRINIQFTFQVFIVPSLIKALCGRFSFPYKFRVFCWIYINLLESAKPNRPVAAAASVVVIPENKSIFFFIIKHLHMLFLICNVPN